ncbi:Trehalose transport system permease protein SugA [Parageobacillus caldoxylosilyticus]|nr:Trehalose transport system permease protein SugA [Parageobacillus caldoxylosilyticus]
MNKMKQREARLGWLMVAPALLAVAAVALYPIVHTFWLSLHTVKLTEPGLGRPFVGLQNYINLLTDNRTLNALWNTIIFTVSSVSLEFVFGLAIALLIHRNFFGRGIVRAAVLVPWAIPTVVSAMMWKFMYNDQYGVINDILKKLGIISEYKAWLGDASWALISLIVTDVWKTTPFMALLLLAGLQLIPEELYESAKVDGAGAWKRFWHITLPMLKPTILVALLFRTLDAFRVFDIVMVMTGGGPGNSTEVISTYAYKVLMRYLDFGNGSALAVIVFVCVFLICLFFITVLGVQLVDDEEGGRNAWSKRRFAQSAKTFSSTEQSHSSF